MFLFCIKNLGEI